MANRPENNCYTIYSLYNNICNIEIGNKEFNSSSITSASKRRRFPTGGSSYFGGVFAIS